MEVTYIDHMGSDLSVVNAARVSFGKHHKEFQNKDVGLINYLATHGHTSPFNHTYITMHIKAPIFVARQLVKHKFMPWNEISRRYVDDSPELYWPTVIREKSKDKKQGSGGKHPTINHGVGTGYYEELKQDVDYLLYSYNWLIKQNVAPEQARMVLPQNTYTEWYWSGTLGAWSGMYNLRSKEDTQWETRQIALQCGEILGELYPFSWKALTQ